MGVIHEVEVRQATAPERDRAVAVEVTAFSADPTMRWLYPEAHDYLRHFAGFTIAFGGLAFGHGSADIAADFGGVALWLPPGEHVDGEGFEAFARKTVTGSRLEDLLEVLEKMDHFHIDEPHWYLAVIGVDTARQGEGIGSVLLSHRLAVCDEAGLPAYLESSNPANIPFYLRHGFEIVDEIQVGSSPVITPMVRTPR